MKTTTHRAATLAAIADDIRHCATPQPAGDWRADALERAGDLALAGRWAESRAQAEAAREEAR